jgi:cysteine desulfurase / selenocysteine lyase
MTEPLCLEKNDIKSDFPVFSAVSKPFTYLDSAATTHSPQSVIDEVVSYYTSSHSNPHSASHDLGEKALKKYIDARKNVASFIGAKLNELVFCSGTTAAINMVAFGYLRNIVRPNSEIVITTMEHHANLIPWQVLAKEKSLSLKVVPLLEDGSIDFQAYCSMLSEKTSFISLIHASNVLGTINPVKDMIAKAKQYDIPVLLDGAQSISHVPVDVKDLDCDFYAFSGHKIYGPLGIGALYIKEQHLDNFTPYSYGGGMIEQVSFNESVFLSGQPEKFEPGTPNVAGAVGLSAAIDYVKSIGMEHVALHERQLLDYANNLLAGIPEVKIYGNSPQKVGVISFTLADIHAHDITSLLNDDGVAVRGGHHCAMPLIKSLGLTSLTRMSFGIYNDFADIDRFVNSLRGVLKVFNI